MQILPTSNTCEEACKRRIFVETQLLVCEWILLLRESHSITSILHGIVDHVAIATRILHGLYEDSYSLRSGTMPIVGLE